MAARHEAELHVVNVTEGEEDKSLPMPLDAIGEWLGREELLSDLESLPLSQKQVEADDPAERLLAYVEDLDIDLVVMGTHGRSGVRRMLLGSVTEAVARRAPCPVLAVRSDAEEGAGEPVRRILAPVDFSEICHKAVQHAKEIARTFDARIDLLHVVENVTYPSPYGLPSLNDAESSVLSPTEEVMTRVEESMRGIARENLEHEDVQIRTTMGHAAVKILDYVEKNAVDLIVIATHGLTGLDRFLLGSVAERVLRQSPVPVLLVKPDQKSLVPPAEAAAEE
jgi:nucleotide-binding universal stress UspA family protein